MLTSWSRPPLRKISNVPRYAFPPATRLEPSVGWSVSGGGSGLDFPSFPTGSSSFWSTATMPGSLCFFPLPSTTTIAEGAETETAVRPSPIRTRTFSSAVGGATPSVVPR